MPLRYAHLSPGHLANYADRTLIGTANHLSKTTRPTLQANSGSGAQ
jgi:hypothetical protein